MSSLTAASAEEWAQVCSESFAPCGIDRVREGFRGTVDSAVYAPAAVARLTCESMDVVRSVRHVTGEPRRDYMLVMHLGGGPGHLEQDGRAAEFQVGQAVLWDASRPYRFRYPTAIRQLLLKVGHDELRQTFDAAPDMCVRPLAADGPALRVLSVFLRELAEVDDLLRDPGRRAELGLTATDLLATALRASRGATTAQAAGHESLIRLMRQYVQDNLGDSLMSPDSIAARHGVSVRYVTALFNEAGTSPAAYVREQRLNLAHSTLGDPRRHELSIAEIARKCGFTDATTFTRAFRRTFGVTPSEYRRTTIL
jgi:AraC-like DNA-binding protein